MPGFFPCPPPIDRVAYHAVATQRTLQEEGKTFIPVEDGAGHTYLFGYAEGGAGLEVFIPETNTHVYVGEDGKVTSIVVDGVVEMGGRRTQEAPLSRKLADCVECGDNLEDSCSALETYCAGDDPVAFLCGDNASTLCSEAAVDAACECPASECVCMFLKAQPFA